MQEINEAIKQYEKATRDAAENAILHEGEQVSINPDCYIARELMYQTAILKNIEHMLRQHINSGMK